MFEKIAVSQKAHLIDEPPAHVAGVWSCAYLCEVTPDILTTLLREATTKGSSGDLKFKFT